MNRKLLSILLLAVLCVPGLAHEYDFSHGSGYHGVTHPVSDDVVPLNFYAGYRIEDIHQQGFNYFTWIQTAQYSEAERKEVDQLGLIRNHTHTTWSVCMYISRCNRDINEQGNLLVWNPPKNKTNLMGFRISWTTTRWLPHDKGDQANRGNHWTDNITREDSPNSQAGIRWLLPSIVVKPGETLRIRIRARYRGEKNGAWSDVLHVPHPGLGCGDKNERIPTSSNLYCHRKY